MMSIHFLNHLPKGTLWQWGRWAMQQCIGRAPGRRATGQRQNQWTILPLYHSSMNKSHIHLCNRPILVHRRDPNFCPGKLFWASEMWVMSPISWQDHVTLFFSQWMAMASIFKYVPNMLSICIDWPTHGHQSFLHRTFYYFHPKSILVSPLEQIWDPIRLKHYLWIISRESLFSYFLMFKNHRNHKCLYFF